MGVRGRRRRQREKRKKEGGGKKGEGKERDGEVFSWRHLWIYNPDTSSPPSAATHNSPQYVEHCVIVPLILAAP